MLLPLRAKENPPEVGLVSMPFGMLRSFLAARSRKLRFRCGIPVFPELGFLEEDATVAAAAATGAWCETEPYRLPSSGGFCDNGPR